MIRKLNSYSVFIILLIFILNISYKTYSGNSNLSPHIHDNTYDNNDKELVLTEEEKSWLKEHPVIKVGSDPNWAPFEFQGKDCDYYGIDIDYLKLIEEKLGVQFEFSNCKNWQEIVEQAYAKEIDLLSGLTMTEERKKHFSFTDIYISHPISVFARKEVTYIRDFKDLSGKKIAVVQDYFTNELLSKNYPDLQLVFVESPQEALKLLNKKQVYAYVEGLVIASYYINLENYNNLRVVGETPYSYQLRIAVRNDWVIFRDILQKALNTITDKEKDYIYYKWISLKVEKKFNFRLFISVLIPSLIILLFFIFWNRKLRHEVNRREQAQQELNNTLEELKNTQTHLVQSEKMSTVGVLTAGIAHEIKNPLNFILMGMQGIIDGIDAYEKIISAYEQVHGEFPKHIIDDIEKLKDELNYNYYRYECESLSKSVGEGVESIHEITKSLNTFSYFAGKEMVLSDINECLKSTLVILRNQYKYHINIVTSYGDLPKIKCFPGKLNQVFVNLISNAIQAIPEKGTITIKSYEEDNFVKVSIKDDGEGMTNEVKKNIFTPFYTTKDISKGTGLGLSISKNIVDEHSGTIEVISEENIGSEFIINLPIT